MAANRVAAASVIALVALTAAVTAGAAGVIKQTADVFGQIDAVHGTRALVADDGATLLRSPAGLTANLQMPTPAPGTYRYPGAQTTPFPFPAAEPGRPEVFSLWMFVFNYPSLCSGPCDANDLGNTPAKGGAFSAGGTVSGGGTMTLAGHVSASTQPFGGSPLLEPWTAEVHLAVAPHGKIVPSILVSQLTKPIGSPPFWWLASFGPPA